MLLDLATFVNTNKTRYTCILMCLLSYVELSQAINMGKRMDYSPEGDACTEVNDRRGNESKANWLHDIDGYISISHI